MNCDIRLQVSFIRHPKIKRLRSEMGPDAVLSLLALWLFTAEHRPHGELRGMDATDIAVASDWNGNADEFTECLLRLRLLDKKRNLFVVHDWENNNPFAYNAPSRKMAAKKAAEAKWLKERTKIVCAPQKSAMRSAEKRNAPIPSPIPTPIPITDIHTTAHEKAIREEIEKRRDQLKANFKLTDEQINIEVEEIVIKTRDRPPGPDVWLYISRWFKNEVRNGRNGNHGSAKGSAVPVGGVGPVPAGTFACGFPDRSDEW